MECAKRWGRHRESARAKEPSQPLRLEHSPAARAIERGRASNRILAPQLRVSFRNTGPPDRSFRVAAEVFSPSPRTPIYTDMSRRRWSSLDTARLSIFTTALAIVVGIAAIAMSGFTGVTGWCALVILVAGLASIPGDRQLLRIGRASDQDSS
jgi:hypothetical protein